MTSFQPSFLPEIDSVEVIVLSGSDAAMRAKEPGDLGTVFLGDVAQRIAECWRALPSGDQARCHIPPFGLIFRREGLVVCAASICWQCNNIHMTVAGQKGTYEFEAEHPVSRRLFDELCGLVGMPEEK